MNSKPKELKWLLSLLLSTLIISARAQISRYDLNFDRRVDKLDVSTLAGAILTQTDSLLQGHQRMMLHSAGDSVYLPTSLIDDITWAQGEGRNLTLHDSIELTITDTLTIDTLTLYDTLCIVDTLEMHRHDTLTEQVTHYITTIVPEPRVCYVQDSLSLAKDRLTNVTFIPIYGQSLSTGCASVPLVSPQNKYKSAIMFDTGIRNPRRKETDFTSFVPLQECEETCPTGNQPDGETAASGCVEMLMELYESELGIPTDDAFWDDHKFLFSLFGATGKRIAELMKEAPKKVYYYQGMVNGVKAAKNICDKLGWTLNVPCFIYIQGESDQTDNVTKAYYADSLVVLQQKFSRAVRQITQQDNDVVCVLHQVASQNITGKTRRPTYGDHTMDVPTAEMELIRDSAQFRGSASTYVLAHSKIEPVHLAAAGQKLLGAYCGRSIFQMLADRPDPTLLMTGVRVAGNDVIVTFSDSVAIDVSYVCEVENYGFTIINPSNKKIITQTRVFDNCVILSCSESPAGCTLYYGFNGVRGLDGYEQGSRGNIRKAGPTQSVFSIAGRPYPMYDYLYSFYSPL